MNTNQTTARKIRTTTRNPNLTQRDMFYAVAEILEAARAADVKTVSTAEKILAVCLDDADTAAINEAYYGRVMNLFAERLPVVAEECGDLVYTQNFTQLVDEFDAARSL